MRKPNSPAAVFAAVLVAASAYAGPVAKHETIKLDRPAVVGSIVVPSGSYTIELGSDPDTVRFLQGSRTVAEAPCKLGLATVVYRGNAVHLRSSENGPDRLTKIVLADSKLSIEVPAPAGVQADVPIAKSEN